jgi:hypothetical protein
VADPHGYQPARREHRARVSRDSDGVNGLGAV